MERRGRPVDGGDARFLHGLEQEHGEGEIFLLKDAAARAERERLVHILAGKIKIKRGLIAEDLIFGIAAEFCHPGREVQDRAVRDDDALRRAGRAGGEDDVQRVELSGPRAATGEQCRVLAACEQVLRDEDRAAGKPLQARRAARSPPVRGPAARLPPYGRSRARGPDRGCCASAPQASARRWGHNSSRSAARPAWR